MVRHYRIAGIQMLVSPSLADNLPVILGHIAWAGRSGAQFVLFPEMALSGYHGKFEQHSVERALQDIAAAAAEHQVCALVGTGYRNGESTTIQVRVYAPTGELVGWHEKLMPTSGDRQWCQPGHELRVLEHQGLRFGVLICNDLWVTPGCGPYPDPRLCYQLGKRGAGVIFHAINSGSAPEYLPYHESNLALRARESAFYIVTANAASLDTPINCSSGVMGPDGHWLLACERLGEQRYLADIELGDQ